MNIEEIKKDYDNTVKNVIIPKLSKYKQNHKRICTTYCLISLIILIAAFICYKNEMQTVSYICMSILSLSTILIQKITKNREKQIKQTIMPKLMQPIPGFYWQLTPTITADEIHKCKIIPFTKIASKIYDDCLLGKYKDTEIEICECRYVFEYITDFSGAFIKIRTNKKFQGLTVIRPKSTNKIQSYADMKLADIEEVSLEDIEFNKDNIVYSTNQIEARYLITTAFIERFKTLKNVFNTQYAYCSFYNDSIYIALETYKDLFELFKMGCSLDNTEQFDILFEEFASILALVDHFKLDQKLGL